tara:strand:+ start:133 stop:369 length:237 start_codon:yes stop_codon:yes gene_type:complete
MRNLFTKHPKETVGETWRQHCYFAIGVGFRLIFTALIFIIHGVFPFIAIPKWLNLEESIRFLARENKNREIKHSKVEK